MNLRYVLKQLGLLLLVLSAILVGVAAIFFVAQAVLKHDVSRASMQALFITGLIGILAGGGAWLLTRKTPAHLGRREALLLVAVSWIAGAAFAALPFFLWAHLPGSDAPDGHPFRSFVDCYFEAMSGLTTTGATILAGDPTTGWDIESVPPGLLLWRAFTQWLGGLGIVVLFVAVLPSLGVGAKRLFQVEAPGPSPEGLQPQIRQTARVLLYIYLALTGAEILALWAARMPFFDAVCHTFTTLATGGFSTRNASTGAFDSVAIDIIVIFFMVLAGVNFSLYFALMRRRFGKVLRDPELRTYAVLLTVGSLVIVLSLLGTSITTTTGETIPASAGPALRHGVFTTVSVATTTGYCTADFSAWPFLAKAVLILLMFIGGSAGSTAGGIKVIRIWIMVKVMLSEIEHVFRPSVIRPVRVGRSIIDDRLKLGTVCYVLGIVLLFTLGSGAVMLLEQLESSSACDFTTAASASVACLCTIGPGLARVGAIENYGWMTPYSKMVLCTLMALGRLEVFALVVLLTPRFWRGD
ncbi:MAG: TrkH family potassium uptake protein [Planctomycetota bacterium]|jgi:trk system potassium uptake protein TrkH